MVSAVAFIYSALNAEREENASGDHLDISLECAVLNAKVVNSHVCLKLSPGFQLFYISYFCRE